jgi:PKD repeat protein
VQIVSFPPKAKKSRKNISFLRNICGSYKIPNRFIMKYFYSRLFALSCLLMSTFQLSGQNFTLTTFVSNASCPGNCNGKAEVNVNPAGSGYTYLWSNGIAIQEIINLCPGIYTVTVTSADGSTRTATVTISQPPPMVLSTCSTEVRCNGGSTGQIDLSVSGGVGAYSYDWSNNGPQNPDNDPQDLNGVGAGTYMVTVTDGNGCPQTTTAVVSQPTPIAIASSVTNAGATGSLGAIDLTVTGGVPPYTYLWSNGSTTPDLPNLQAGTYTVTVTDSNGCSRVHTVSVLANSGTNAPPVLINAVVTNIGCQPSPDCSGAINLTITGGSPNTYYYVKWSTPNGFSLLQEDIFNICDPGTYCAFVADSLSGVLLATGCYTVSQAQAQQLDIQSSNAAFCNYNSPGSPPICEMVCPRTTLRYFIAPQANPCFGPPITFSGAAWTVSGAESYTVNPNGKEVDVTWGPAGSGLITFEIAGSSACFSGSHCVTIVEEPQAKFSSDPPAPVGGSLQLCKGQTVTFKNESLYAEQYEWLFSDNLSSESTENPQHTFLTPGNFTVTLIARSNCLCADTTVLQVEVLDSEPPLLDCVGSVCPGETVKYATSSNCSSYTWSVSPNGVVVDGGGLNDNSITVQWGQGPTGTISLSASGCGGAVCPQASVFIIPIISDNAEIRGDESVCPGSEEEYSLNLFDGTEYTWKLSGGGTITSGQGTNKVSVAWTATANSSTTHWLSVVYYNCYLGCGGEDSIPVKILSPFFVQGPVELCEKGTGNMVSRLVNPATPVKGNWSIFKADGSLFWNSVPGVDNVNFPTNAPPGKYRVSVAPTTPGQTCSENAELIVTVVARPPKPAAIAGPKVICPNTPLTYTVLGTEPYTVSWTVTNGTPATATGNPANITWNNNLNRWLSAMYISTDGLGCRSDTTKLDIKGISGLSISGVSNACISGLAYYSADGAADFDYQWQVIPADAGTIKSGQGQNAVEIFWQNAGNHKLRVTVCGQQVDFNVTVSPNPVPMVNAPDGICAGDSSTITTLVPYSQYSWENADGTVLGINASVRIPSGNYVVAVTDANGCMGSSDFAMPQRPKPNVSVTTANATGFCNNSSTVSMTALVSSSGTFSYTWLHDGVPVGGNSPVYASNQYGYYTVVVTNEFGCTATAPPILLFNYCGGGGGIPSPLEGPPPCPPGSVVIMPDPTPRCDSINLTLQDNTGLYVPGSAQWWTGISGGAQVGTAAGDNVNFVYPNAGKYVVVMVVALQNGSACLVIDSVQVEAAAQFTFQEACPGDSTQFLNQSTNLPGASITGWVWDFGVAGNGDVSNLPSPGFPYPNSGAYTATLTITTATGCTASYSEEVVAPNLPTPGFAVPVANCAGNASPFTLANPAGIIDAVWNFGDPASGALNQGTGNTVFHLYSPAGTYPVSVTATNTYGCTASFSQNVNITGNPFSGNITPLNPVICEGKTVTLVAPLGPAATYVWSDGTSGPTLTVSLEGVYDVTLTNGNGCSYSPLERLVDVIPAPVGTIKALQLNELGQVIGVSYPTLSVCYGEDVNLQIQENGNYTYQWNTGSTTDILIFSEDRDNLLSVGTHTYTVTLTDQTTGCTAIMAPFEVTVNPVPSGFNIDANGACAGTPTLISYSGPQQPTWDIFWNTGAVGPSITTTDAGLYFVRVINEFGCSAQSNTVVVFPGPNVAALPSGCHERCNPDSLCLPAIPGIVSWQWFFEGNPIPGATSNQLHATQSGTYYAQLQDAYGCHAQSADLTLELYDGYGNVLGHVWSDLNNNGVIDPADTLVGFIPVQLWQNGSLVNSNVSGPSGSFDWQNVLATSYTVQIDSAALNPLWDVVILSDSVGLSGCGGKVYADLLIKAYECPPTYASVTLSACPGSTAMYNGTAIPAGQSMDFTTTFGLGCDSIVTVTVNALPTSASTLAVKACPGGTYTYAGVDLAVGQTQDFTLINAAGCDSIVTVTVSALPTSASTLAVKACPGGTYTYAGVDLAVGQSQDFTLVNAVGCDSIVTVTVSALPTSASTLAVKACPGGSYTYAGVDLAVGQSQDFTLVNAVGCDSIVTVTVSALPTSASTLAVKACPGGTYTYAGVAIPVGQSQDFTLVNAVGCDSIVTVTVSALPTSASTLAASACPGSTYTYAGVNLAVGQTQDFTLVNAAGCDSIVTVTVSALPTSSGAVTFGVCPNETYTFQGQALAAGAVQNFTLSNQFGCDSILTVTIVEKASSADIVEVMVCPGESYIFNGQKVEIGQTKDFHFSNSEGCDSLITIRVTAWPGLQFDATAQRTCPNQSQGSLTVNVLPGGSQPTGYSLNGGPFQGDNRFIGLAAGDYTLAVQDANGCVFEEQVTVPASPALQVILHSDYIIPCSEDFVTLAPIFGGDTSGLQLNWWNGAHTLTTSTAEAGPVWLEASNHCGETLRREAQVQWASSDGYPINIYVPNIFAPDAKNHENRQFRAFIGNNLTLLDYRLEVYDRWGSLLFKSEQPEVGWEGSFRDKIMEPGVFVWQLWTKVAFCGRELDIYQKGDVTVER